MDAGLSNPSAIKVLMRVWSAVPPPPGSHAHPRSAWVMRPQVKVKSIMDGELPFLGKWERVPGMVAISN